MRQWYDGVGMGILAVGTAVALVAVPVAAWTEVARPEVRALYAYGGVLAVLAWLRWSGRELLEPRILAVFLAAMPLVYLEAGWSAGAPLGVEVVGLGIYAALAAAGLRWPWLLVAGIALHGVGWDLWHLHRGPVTDWYAIGCAAVDVSLAGCAASRVPAWVAL